jgi:cold shock CspA family protein/ribosome-associated translation inhibitor RaiA
MQFPLQLSFRGIPPSEAVEARVREYVERLEHFYPRITSCRVMVEAQHHRHHKGNVYHVRINVSVPGREIVVKRDPAEHVAHQDLYVALRDAFAAATRQIEDFARELRADVKTHAEPLHGRVAKLFSEAGYGFIETPDGREIYFHQSSVREGSFGDLAIGAEVRFAEEAGEKGPQASSLVPTGRRVAEE